MLVVFFSKFIVAVGEISLAWLAFAFQLVFELAIVNDNWFFNHLIKFFWPVNLHNFVFDRIFEAFIIFRYNCFFFSFCLCWNLLEFDSVCCYWFCLFEIEQLLLCYLFGIDVAKNLDKLFFQLFIDEEIFCEFSPLIFVWLLKKLYYG